MTRKDYAIVAAAIKRAYIPDDDARISLMAELAIEFVKDNPRFNYETFKAACKPDYVK